MADLNLPPSVGPKGEKKTEGQRSHKDKFIDAEQLERMSNLTPKTKVRLPLIPWMLRIIYDIAEGDKNKNAGRRARALLELYERNPRRAEATLVADDEYEIELIEQIMEE